MAGDKVKRSVAEYWKGSQAYKTILAREKAGKKNFVPSPVANGRAKICSNCPHNKAAGKVVAAIDNAVLKQVGERKTRFDDEIFNCDACSCPLKLLVHLNPDLLRIIKDPSDLKKRAKAQQKAAGKPIPKDCWQMRLFNITP